MKETSDIWIALIGTFGGIVTMVLGYMLKYWFEKKPLYIEKNKDAEVLEKDVDFYFAVKQKLTDLLDDFHCDRITIFEFHNGGHFYHRNRSMQKFSASFEAVNWGISEISENFKNVMVTSWIFLFKELFTLGEFYKNNLEELNDWGLSETLSKVMGIKTLFALPLKNTEDQIIGFILYQYTKEETELSDETKQKMKTSGSYLSGYINMIYEMTRGEEN